MTLKCRQIKLNDYFMIARLTLTSAIALLLLITVLALLVNQWLPERRLLVDGLAGLDISVVDDRANGGQSVATLVRDGKRLIVECDIVASSYQWPFCELNIDLRQDQLRGVDLSRMDRIELTAEYARESNLGIRFQLRNYSPLYSAPDDKSSLKYVGLEYFGRTQGKTVSFPVNSLQVPTWWLVERALPVERMGPEVNNVHHLEIATGNGIKPGRYELRIEGVAFIGKYISQELLYLGLLVLWVGAAIFYLTARVIDQQRSLKKAKNRRHELEAVNRMLDFQRKELEDKLDKDPLTGALNRDGIYKIFSDDGSSSSKATLSVMFLDLDKFKSINDNYGHNVGDQVLVMFSELIRSNTRDSDVLARWGGEEFILACPNTSVTNAQKVAEALCQKIRDKSWPEDIPVTCSFGVAEMSDESIEELIERADKALYEAKNTGRDKVVVSQKP